MDAPDKFVAAVLTAYIMHTKKETFAKEFVEENYEGLNDTQKENLIVAIKDLYSQVVLEEFFKKIRELEEEDND